MYLHALSGSGGFSSAIADIKQYFPTGLFCQPSSMITEYEVSYRFSYSSCVGPHGNLLVYIYRELGYIEVAYIKVYIIMEGTTVTLYMSMKCGTWATCQGVGTFRETVKVLKLHVYV